MSSANSRRRTSRMTGDAAAPPRPNPPDCSTSRNDDDNENDEENDNDKYNVNGTISDADDDHSCALLLLPTLLVTMALAFSFAGGFWCRLAVLPVNPAYQQDGTTALAPEWIGLVSNINYGLMSQQKVVVKGVTTTASSSNSSSSNEAANGAALLSSSTSVAVYVENVCVSYPSNLQQDGNWSAAYGLQIASWTVSGLVLLALLWMLLRTSNTTSSRSGGGGGGPLALCGFLIVLGGDVLQGLVFLFYQGDLCTNNPLPGIQQLQQVGILERQCRLGSGAILLIVAMTLYFVAGISACYAASQATSKSHRAPTSSRSIRSRSVYPQSDERDDEIGDDDDDIDQGMMNR